MLHGFAEKTRQRNQERPFPVLTTVLLRLILAFAAVNGALAVAGGAYATHVLTEAHAVERFQLAGQYQFIHALALLAVVLLRPAVAALWARVVIALAGLAFMLGLALFCGVLYANALLGAGPWSPLAPVGGISFLVGWLLLALGAFGWSAPGRRT